MRAPLCLHSTSLPNPRIPRSGKNVASSFAKSDAQSHLARRVPEPDRDRLREAKRRRLLGDENAAGQSDGTKALASAPPEGKVRSARHAPQDSAVRLSLPVVQALY